MDALDIFTYVGQRSEDSSTCPSVPGLDLGLDWTQQVLLLMSLCVLHFYINCQ